MTPLLCAALLTPAAPLPALRGPPCRAPDPLARDLAPFPPAAVALARRDFARKRLYWLRGQRDSFGGAALGAAVRDQEWRYRCWDELADAAAYGQDGCDRRAALGRLRVLLGDDDYRLGRMPEPAEWGQFGRID